MYDVVRRCHAKSRSVAVGFSCGKDSIATLDLACKHFSYVVGFFMYMVPGLQFQESYIKFIENRYGIQIMRIPHFQLGMMFRNASLRNPTGNSADVPLLAITDIEAHVRNLTGVEWIAYGHKTCDSIERNGMLKANGGIDESTGRMFPIAFWKHSQVKSYLRLNNIPLPRDYDLFGHSFGRLWAPELEAIKSHFPEDYERIIEVFPYAEAQIKRAEFKRA
jgi:phosphoadenosine phosphosulfate reductase